MENSVRYDVNGVRFPATPVATNDVLACLNNRSTDLVVRHIDIDPEPVHAGYTGYVVATGTAS